MFIETVYATPSKITNAGNNLTAVVGKTGVAQTDVTTFAGSVIKTGLSLVGIAFLVLMVYAGFMWMTARGNEDQITKAKGTITTAIIGLVIVVSAYAITTFVVGKLV